MTRNNEFSICQCACFEERKIGNFVITQKQKKCPKGFSELQIMILSILKSYNDVLTYSQLTGAVNSNFGLQVTETSVRGAVERLAKKKVFMKKHIRSGFSQGNKYTFKDEPCEFIKALPSDEKFATKASSHKKLEEASTKQHDDSFVANPSEANNAQV